MDIFQALSSRRSVRTFLPDPIAIEEMQEIVAYGLSAPSAHNQQAWKYYLINAQQHLDFLGLLMEYGKMIPQAQWVLLACYDETCLRAEEFIQQDMGASIQNILLAAHGKEIGAVWVGLYPHQEQMEAISSYFSLGKEIVPFALVAFGKSDQFPSPKKIRGTLEML